MLRSDHILKQIESLCRKHFEQGKIKVQKVLVSPYYPVVVIETIGHSEYNNTKNRLSSTAERIHHHYCHEVNGLKKLWEDYLVYRGVD